MQFDIRSNVVEVSRWLDDVQRKQLPFATVLAMTMTAKDIRAEEISVMKRVFDRPTPYTLNALAVKPAKKSTMVASVEFKEGFSGTPAKRFLNPNVNGGPRSQRSSELQIAPLLKGYSYLVPASGYPLNAYGNVPGSQMRRVISQLKVSRNADANASQSARSKRKRRAQAFFVNPAGNMVMERRGKEVRPVLIGVRVPNYTKRFPFYETARTVLADRMAINFEIAFQRAMASARPPRG